MLFSYSRLALYQQCPYRFYMKYVLLKPEPVTKPLALGKAVHKAIESRINGKPEEQAIWDGLVESDFHPEVSKEEVEKLLRAAPNIRGKTEIHFELPLSSSGPRIQGYIDLLSAGEFYDWKSNWRPYGVNDTKQLPLYAWAIMQLEQRDFVRGSLFFLRYHRLVSHLFDRTEAEEARLWAYRLADEIELKLIVMDVAPDEVLKLFPAQPGSHCRHCPFALDCYVKSKTDLMI